MISSIAYWALLGIVCLAPLPLASNRPLPWSLLSLSVGVLLLIWGASRFHAALLPARESDALPAPAGIGRAAHARVIDQHAAWLVAGFAGLMMWYWIQGSRLLSGAWGHAAWAEASAALGEHLPASASLDPAAGHTLMMKVLAYGGVFLLAFELGRDRDRARTAFWVVCVAGFGYALYGLFVHFSHARVVLWFDKDAYPESVTATFINRNAYATYAGMAVLAGLAVLLSELRRFRRDRTTTLGILVAPAERGSAALYLAVAAVITGLVAVVLTGSRAGIACLVLALAVFAVGILVARDIRLRTFVVGAVLACGVIASALLLSGGIVGKRLTSDSAPEARAAVFDVARSATAEYPWVGQGLGAFGPAFNRANDGRAVFDTYVDLAHNAYLELAVEGGIPAMLLSLALVGGCVGICFTGLFARGRGTNTSIAAIAIATLVGTHALVDFGIQMPAVAATFMLLIGAAAAQALAVEPAGRMQESEAESRTEERWRAPRRRRFGRDRPLGADDPVTPPPESDMPWPVRRRPIDRAVLARISAPEAVVLEQSAPEVRAEEASPPAPARMPDDEPASAAGDYDAALARWRALREAGATAFPEPDAPSGRMVTTRPPTPALPETSIANDPEPAFVPSAQDSGVVATPHAESRPQPAYPSQASQPAIVPFAPRDPANDQPPPRDPPPVMPEDAAEATQPPTPPAWPGSVAPSSEPGPDDDAPRDGPDRRTATIIGLPRSPRP